MLLATLATPASADPISLHDESPTTSCRVWVSKSVPVRPEPNFKYETENSLRPNQWATVDGRDQSKSWLHIVAPYRGWVGGYYLQCGLDISQLAVKNDRDYVANLIRTIESARSCFNAPLNMGGWQLEPGWRVMNLGGRDQVLAGQAPAGQRSAWASRNDENLRDLVFVSYVNLSSRTIHLNFRRSGRTRYYVGFSANELYLKKTVNGQPYDLAYVALPHAPNTWHRVQVDARSDNISVFVDYQLELVFTDPDPLGPGGIAFETLPGASALVDDVQVCALKN